MTSSLTLYFEDGNMTGIFSLITPLLYLLYEVSSSLLVIVSWTLFRLPK